ncbi:unnamed protein product [Aphanomyces euteiches]
MKTFKQFIVHIERCNSFFRLVNEGKFGEMYWLPAFMNPGRLLNLLSYHAVKLHFEDELEHYQISFLIAESFPRESPMKYYSSQQKVEYIQVQNFEGQGNHINLTGIMAYNASWNEETKTFTKPSKMNGFEELPPILLTVTKSLDCIKSFGDIPATVNVYEMPVYQTKYRDAVPSMQVVFSLCANLPEDEDERTWLLAHAYLVIA